MKNKILIIILAIFFINFISGLSVDENTVAFWNFDEGSGINVIDKTENGNNGILIGGTTWTSDSVSDFALEMDGIGDYVQVTKTSSLDVDEVTLEASVKRKSNTDGIIFSRNGPYYLAIRNNVISGGVMTTTSWGELSGVTLLEQDVWYNLKLTYDGQNIHLYVNEVLDASMPKTGNIIHASQTGYIGYGEPGQNQFFTGVIDEVSISNIARNSISEPPEPSLDERISILEEWKILIDNWREQLAEILNQIAEKLDNHENRINELENNSNPEMCSYFKYLSSAERKNIVCEYAKTNNLTNYIDLGWNCTIVLRINPRTGENFKLCNCKVI